MSIKTSSKNILLNFLEGKIMKNLELHLTNQ